MGDEQSLTNGVWSITIKKAEQNANGHDADAGVGKPAAEEDIAAHDNDEDTVPLGLTTKAVCMQVSVSFSVYCGVRQSTVGEWWNYDVFVCVWAMGLWQRYHDTADGRAACHSESFFGMCRNDDWFWLTNAVAEQQATLHDQLEWASQL